MILVGASGNDPKNDFEIFLKNYAWLLCVIVVAIIIVVLVIVFVIKRNKKVPTGKIVSEASSDEWALALGGLDNISDIYSTGSRLSILLKNPDLINRDELTKLGVSSIVLMSNKVTLVSNLDNQKIVEKIKNSLQN